MADKDYSVVVVGAGPSGLAAAIELGMRGVRCLLVERNDRVGYAPRAKTTNVRTRTHLRRWGIANRLAAASPFGIAYPATVHFVTRLGGHALARIENASNCDPAPDARYPEHGQWIPQYALESVLRDHAATLPGVEIVFGTEVTRARQDGDGVTLTLRDGARNQETEVSCSYAIGADGARSRLRDVIGASMKGRYGLSRNYNIVFRAPGLAQAHSHGPGTMYWQVNPDMPSLIGPMDRDDVWFFMPTRLPEGVTLTAETAPAMIRRSTGIDLPYQVLSSDEWVASSVIADRYRAGRIFLIGDACHLHPPFGGYGMNMGIADGVDLGWKLAAVLSGWGGPRLLDSYEMERRTIHREVIAEAEANHAVLSNDFTADELEADTPAGATLRAEVGGRILAAKVREFHTLGTVLGGCYGASPILPHADVTPPGRDGRAYVPVSRPGCLAPHLWLAEDRSLYDAFGPGFALLVRHGADDDAVACTEAASTARGIPLHVVRLPADVDEALYPAPLTLVRPDQHVAWRGDRWHAGVLELATGWAGVSVA